MFDKKIKKVVSSFEDETGFLCVDIIFLFNGKFSFQSYRRDPEDNSGWFPTEGQSPMQYATEHEAIQKARMKYPWMVV